MTIVSEKIAKDVISRIQYMLTAEFEKIEKEFKKQANYIRKLEKRIEVLEKKCK